MNSGESARRTASCPARWLSLLPPATSTVLVRSLLASGVAHSAQTVYPPEANLPGASANGALSALPSGSPSAKYSTLAKPPAGTAPRRSVPASHITVAAVCGFTKARQIFVQASFGSQTVPLGGCRHLATGAAFGPH